MVPEDSWKKEFKQLNRKIDRLSVTNEKLVSQGIKLSNLASRVKTRPLPSRAFPPSLQIPGRHWMAETHELPSWKNS